MTDTKVEKSTKTRRKFLTGAAGVAAGGAAAIAMPNVATAAPTVLKVQAAWGGGIFLEDAKNYVARVNAATKQELRPTSSSRACTARHRGSWRSRALTGASSGSLSRTRLSAERANWFRSRGFERALIAWLCVGKLEEEG